MVVKVRLFGALKKYGNDGVISLELPQDFTQAEFRDLIKEALRSASPGTFQEVLVDSAALASGTQVLNKDEAIKDITNLALLPPVCGG